MSGGPLRLLSARLLQEQMLRVGRSSAVVEQELATRLRSMARGRDHRVLGFRRLSDYLAEGPGLTLAACRALVRLDRARDAVRAVSDRPAPAPAAAALAGQPTFDAPFGLIGGTVAGTDAPDLDAGRDTDITMADFETWMDVTRTVREALRPLGPGAGPAASMVAATGEPHRIDGDGAPGLFERAPAVARALDAGIRDTVRRAQALAWRQARLMSAAARHGLHREAGFATLHDWAAQILGLTPPRVEALLRIERLLRPLPAVEDAFRRGRLTWRRALEVVRAARPDTEKAWIHEARRVPLRKLEASAGAAISGRARARGESPGGSR
jgi:hypothetical protein